MFGSANHTDGRVLVNNQHRVCKRRGAYLSLQWHCNGHDGISNHQPYDCLLNRLFSRWSKTTSKLGFTGLCEGNSPMTGEFPAQRASNAEKCFHLMTSSFYAPYATGNHHHAFQLLSHSKNKSHMSDFIKNNSLANTISTLHTVWIQ